MRSLPRAGVAVLAVVGLALLAACSGETTPSPEASATATAAAPSETTAGLAAAREYERNGQYEEAVAAYQGVIHQADGQTQQQARYDLALTYITIEQYADAATELKVYIDAKPSPEDNQRARFLLAGPTPPWARPTRHADLWRTTPTMRGQRPSTPVWSWPSSSSRKAVTTRPPRSWRRPWPSTCRPRWRRPCF